LHWRFLHPQRAREYVTLPALAGNVSRELARIVFSFVKFAPFVARIPFNAVEPSIRLFVAYSLHIR
jgi:hypothetical protein